MTEEAKAEELVDGLRDAFASNIREAVKDMPAHQALQLADSLCSVWISLCAGMRVTHRNKPPIDGDAITRDWVKGLSLAEITRDHKCSRATAYKYHPRNLKKLDQAS